MSLRSPGGSYKNIIPDLIAENEFIDTAYMDQFPSVKKLLHSLDCAVMSARFLNLHAGAVIKKHTDAELAFEKGEARLHFPVFTNPGVEFYCENERIFFQAGECWYLNANLPHSVSNQGDMDRIHLVVDCKVNPWLREKILTANPIAVKKETEDHNLWNMIKELRYQNTVTANKLADALEEKAKKIPSASNAE
jgi:mannose-6-phosphate isomerase-like protein (cupin superfamily)